MSAPRFTLPFCALLFGSLVFAISVFRTATPAFTFSGSSIATPDTVFDSKVAYFLPYPGILPDSPLWFVKAFRDRVWVLVTRDPLKRAQIGLLLADKRIAMVRELVEEGNVNLSVATAVKAEQYLDFAFREQDRARESGVDTTGFLQLLAHATFKHKEILLFLFSYAPEDAQPIIRKSIDYPDGIYENIVHRLNEKGREVPTPPFE